MSPRCRKVGSAEWEIPAPLGVTIPSATAKASSRQLAFGIDEVSGHPALARKAPWPIGSDSPVRRSGRRPQRRPWRASACPRRRGSRHHQRGAVPIRKIRPPSNDRTTVRAVATSLVAARTDVTALLRGTPRCRRRSLRPCEGPSGGRAHRRWMIHPVWTASVGTAGAPVPGIQLRSDAACEFDP
jgi:hypothetical protein